MTGTVLNGTAPASAVDAPVQAGRRPPLWYRDPVSCLHAAFAAAVAMREHDPLEVLGSAWEFRHLPGDVRSEEFYLPCRYEGDLGRSLAPYHALSSRWATPADDRDPLGELESLLSTGRLPVAAVDNYHLPFRPAYHDVHAAHLVLVYGIDRARGLVLVSDAMPPAFSGPLPVDDFLAAWGSANPADEQDAFFSASRIDRRYLVIDVGDADTLDRAGLRTVLLANGSGFGEPADVPEAGPWTGLAGLRRYVAWIIARATAGDRESVRGVYPFGWSMQAQASLHGELLRSRGSAWDVPELREAGRAVEAVAHTWTGLRLTAAHGWSDPAAVAGDLAHHGSRLCRRYETADGLVRRAAEALRLPTASKGRPS